MPVVVCVVPGLPFCYWLASIQTPIIQTLMMLMSPNPKKEKQYNHHHPSNNTIRSSVAIRRKASTKPWMILFPLYCCCCYHSSSNAWMLLKSGMSLSTALSSFPRPTFRRSHLHFVGQHNNIVWDRQHHHYHHRYHHHNGWQSSRHHRISVSPSCWTCWGSPGSSSHYRIWSSQQQQQRRTLSSSPSSLSSPSLSVLSSTSGSKSDDLSVTTPPSSLSYDSTSDSSSTVSTTTTISSSSSSSTSWNGESSPFSDYATHVLVGKDDAPVNVVDAIIRSIGQDRINNITNNGYDYDEEKDEEKVIASSLRPQHSGPYINNTDVVGNGNGGVIDYSLVPQQQQKQPTTLLTPKQLLYLGSIWYMPSYQYRHNQQQRQMNQQQQQQQQQQQPQQYHDNDYLYKPIRLTLANATNMILQEGDYLRIHHTPRRFLNVYRYDWRVRRNHNSDHDNNNNRMNNNDDTDPNQQQQQQQHHYPYGTNNTIVKVGFGYCIVNKPPLIPVHGTVDNKIENVIYQLENAMIISERRQKDEMENIDAITLTKEDNRNITTTSTNNNNNKKKKDDDDDDLYVAAVQRLDINTSGLLVVATKPEFASYFARLLRQKTVNQTLSSRTSLSKSVSKSSSLSGTDHQQQQGSNITSTTSIKDGTDDLGSPHQTNTTTMSGRQSNRLTIYKGYRCLVCIRSYDDSNVGNDGKKESILQAWERLANLQTTKSDRPIVIKHYLKVSERAPKEFVSTIPTEAVDGSNKDGTNTGNTTTTTTMSDQQWQECLLQITKVSPPIPLQSDPSLVAALWPQSTSMVPPNVKAVAEVEVSLLTGRTHQIRGQLSQLGFPLVGDEQYGGAIPSSTLHDKEADKDDNSTKKNIYWGENKQRCVPRQQQQQQQQQQLLALQCCQLSFLDADYHTVWNPKKRKYVAKGRPNQEGRWVEAQLDGAWWTPILKDRTHGGDNYATGMIDVGINGNTDEDRVHTSIPNRSIPFRPDLLPPLVQLSPGKNKYIMAKIRDPETSKVVWFVKSATPNECGGDYHANVAQDLVEWIHAVPGYENVKVDITGGGRIDYVPASRSSPTNGMSTAHVYGFSYRYGKGDHARAATLIEAEYAKMGHTITATYDESDSLY